MWRARPCVEGRVDGGCRFGVARVYAQQCGYVLADAETAKDKMLTMLKSMQIDTHAKEDVEKHRGRCAIVLNYQGDRVDFT